jgi:hypothetical protein
MMLSMPLCLNSLVLLNLLQENTSAFDDLGTLLIGGVAAAIVVAVAVTLVRFRMRDKKEESHRSSRMFTD